MAVTLHTDLRCEVHSWRGEFGPRIHSAWKQLVDANRQATIFQFPEWMEYACQAGVVMPSRLLTVSHSDRLIALIPLQQRTPWTWELSVPLSPEYSPLLIDVDEEAVAWSAILRWLRTQSAVKRICLGPCGDTKRLQLFEHACWSEGLTPRLQPAPTYVHIPLAPSWEAFLSGLGKSTRNKLRRIDAHLLNMSDDSRVEFQDEPSACAEALDDLMRLYRARWEQQIGGCAFCKPQSTAFYHRFIQWAVQQHYAVIPILRVGGRTLAVGSVFHLPGQSMAYFHFIARDADALPNHWLNAPGIKLLGRVIRWAIERGVTTLGMGAGCNHYKMLLGGEETPLRELTVARSALDDRLIPHLDNGLHLIRRLPVHFAHYGRQLGHKGSTGDEE